MKTHRRHRITLASLITLAALTLIPTTSKAEVNIDVQGGVAGKPAAAKVCMNINYGMKPYILWGGDLCFQGGEPWARINFGPGFMGFFDPFNSGFRIVPLVTIGPIFFQDPTEKFKVGGITRYGGGLGWEFENGTYLLGNFFGTTKIGPKNDRDNTNEWNAMFTFGSVFGGGG